MTPAAPSIQTDLLRKIEHAREQVEWWEQERDDLIAQAYTFGVSTRGIATAARMGCQTIRSLAWRKRHKETA